MHCQKFDCKAMIPYKCLFWRLQGDFAVNVNITLRNTTNQNPNRQWNTCNIAEEKNELNDNILPLFFYMLLKGRSILGAGHPPERSPDAGRNPQVSAGWQTDRGPGHSQAAIPHTRRLGRTVNPSPSAALLLIVHRQSVWCVGASSLDHSHEGRLRAERRNPEGHPDSRRGALRPLEDPDEPTGPGVGEGRRHNASNSFSVRSASSMTSSIHTCVVILRVQDIQQESQTTLERKTLRRAFYSREAKNQMDDDEEGDGFTFTFLFSHLSHILYPLLVVFLCVVRKH